MKIFKNNNFLCYEFTSEFIFLYQLVIDHQAIEKFARNSLELKFT
jgi:hypothetical protein